MSLKSFKSLMSLFFLNSHLNNYLLINANYVIINALNNNLIKIMINNSLNPQLNLPPAQQLSPEIDRKDEKEKKEAENTQGRFRHILMGAFYLTGAVISIISIAYTIYYRITADIPKWNKEIESKFSKEILGRIQRMEHHVSKDCYLRIMRRLSKAANCELAVLKDIFLLTDDHQHLLQIFQGAHIRIVDEKGFYDRWKKLQRARPRSSSHYRSRDNTQQYAISGRFLRECLFGKLQATNEFWFQLESYPAGFGTYVRHFYAFLKYKISDHNQGPYGSSPHIDSRALELDRLHKKDGG